MLDADADARCVHPLRLGGCAHGIVTKTTDNSGGVLVGGGGVIMTLCYEIDPLRMA